jgi:hypothetical protein
VSRSRWRATAPGFVATYQCSPSAHDALRSPRQSRCIVPFTSFAENDVLPDRSRPRMRSTRPGRSRSSPACGPDGLRYAKVKKGETTNDLFAFLTMSRTLEAGHPGRTAWPVRLATISATRGQCAGDRPFVPRTMGFSVGVGQPCGFSAATKPAQHHRRSEQRPISAAPTIGGFFMTKKPDRSGCSTRCLATIAATSSAASCVRFLGHVSLLHDFGVLVRAP